MIKFLHGLPPIIFVLIATILEVSGDALIRKSIYEHTGIVRVSFVLIGALLLLGYGVSVNLTSLGFGKVAGLYIATLFVVWQITNYFAFRTFPSTPVIVGGLFIVVGGLIITFWKQ